MPRSIAGTRLAATNRQTIQNSNASLYMDGNAGYLTLPITPSPTGFNFGTWVKTGKRTASSVNMLLSSNSAAFTDGFWFGKGNGRGEFEFVGYNSTNSINTALRTGQVSDGMWAHVAVTYQPSGVCSIYLNGVLVNTVTATNTISTGTTSIYVGRRSYIATFAGLNASQLVWHNTTTPWTAAQVLALYQSGTVPTGATAVYPLNEGAGTIAYDTSGNGNNGTITSGTWSRETPSKTRKNVNGNMVYNGDFEIAPVVNVATTATNRWIDGTSGGSTTNDVFGWGTNKSGTVAAMFDSTTKKSGNYSLELSTTATASYIEAHPYPGFIDGNEKMYLFPALPNTSYTITYWMKTNYVSGDASQGATVSMNEHNGVGTLTIYNSGTNVKTTTDWTQYTFTVTTAAATRFISPQMKVYGHNGAGTLIMDAWFDNIELYPTTPITRSAA